MENEKVINSIRKGQWVRLHDNRIVQIGDFCPVCGKSRHTDVRCDSDIMRHINNGDYVAVEDNPIALLQYGDLIKTRYRNDINVVTDVWHKQQSVSTYDEEFYFDQITAIYTPNKDETQYTEQWRAYNSER